MHANNKVDNSLAPLYLSHLFTVFHYPLTSDVSECQHQKHHNSTTTSHRTNTPKFKSKLVGYWTFCGHAN